MCTFTTLYCSSHNPPSEAVNIAVFFFQVLDGDEDVDDDDVAVRNVGADGAPRLQLQDVRVPVPAFAALRPVGPGMRRRRRLRGQIRRARRMHT